MIHLIETSGAEIYSFDDAYQAKNGKKALLEKQITLFSNNIKKALELNKIASQSLNTEVKDSSFCPIVQGMSDNYFEALRGILENNYSYEGINRLSLQERKKFWLLMSKIFNLETGKFLPNSYISALKRNKDEKAA